jgi:hypothetical protein
MDTLNEHFHFHTSFHKRLSDTNDSNKNRELFLS